MTPCLTPASWGAERTKEGAKLPVRLMGLCACIMALQAALKKYQTEQRSKGDALDKCQAELKKLRKKSQGSKNPQKYSDKELQVGLFLPPAVTSYPLLARKSLPIYLCACRVSVKRRGELPGVAGQGWVSGVSPCALE